MSEILQNWENISNSCGWWYPFENICFICDRPKEINKKGVQLHADDKPALLFRDGYCLWYLNGVEVPKEIVLTPSKELDPKLILVEKNAEVRREIVRKIGIERVIQKLGATILDTQDNYQLLRLSKIEGMENNPVYLKMKNPSIGVWHVEGVDSNCKTVGYKIQDENGFYDSKNVALHFRKPLEMQKIPIHDEGNEWYQQGDVCIWPKNSKSLKPYPSILT